MKSILFTIQMHIAKAVTRLKEYFLAFLASSAIKNGIAEVAKKKQLSWVMFSHICAKHLLSKDFIVQIYPNGKMLEYASTRSLWALRAPPPGWRPLVLLPLSFAPFGYSSLVTHADESTSIIKDDLLQAWRAPGRAKGHWDPSHADSDSLANYQNVSVSPAASCENMKCFFFV